MADEERAAATSLGGGSAGPLSSESLESFLTSLDSFDPSVVSVVVFGDTRLATHCLELLCAMDGYSCVGLIQSAKQTVYTPASATAHTYAVPVYTHAADGEALARLVEGLAPDILLLATPSMTVPDEVLMTARVGCCGVHLSLLPRHRGPCPLQWAIIERDTKAGASWIQLQPRGLPWIGPCLAQTEVSIDEAATPPSLLEAMLPAIVQLLPEALQNLQSNTTAPISQLAASLEPAIGPEHVTVDWTADAGTVDALLRGALPWPGALTNFGELSVRVEGRANKIDRDKQSSSTTKGGTVLAVTSAGLLLATGTPHQPALLTHLQLTEPGNQCPKLAAETWCVQRGVVPGVVLGAR